MKQENLKKGSFYRVYKFDTAYKKCLESDPVATEPLSRDFDSCNSQVINMISKVVWEEMFKSPVKFYANSVSGNSVFTAPYCGVIHEIYLPPCVIWKEVEEE